jgi:uroporphyrinogen decarboxylase
MTQLTSRARVTRALNHQEPDQVPTDIGGGTSTTLVVEAYRNLRSHLGLPAGEIKTLSKQYRSARLDHEVMQRLGSDCYPLRGRGPANWTPPPAGPGEYTDIWGVRWREIRYREDAFYWEVAQAPLAEAGIDDLATYAWPDTGDPGYTAGLAEEARTLYEQTDYAIEASCGFYSFFETGYALRGYEQLFADFSQNPDFVLALFEKLLEINLAGTRRFLDAAGRYITIFRMADDLASQTSLLMSPKMYRTFLKPFHRRYIEFVKAHTDAKVLFHSDGKVTPLLDDLIEIGVDVLNPVQPSALGDLAALKTQYGDRLCFSGAIDTQQVLPTGSVADVCEEVKQRIGELGPGGGYILSSVHSIAVDVPPQNVLAMADAARNYGRYPIRVG